jgi:hypothetical protein
MEQPAATGAAQVAARMDEYLAALRQAGQAEQAAAGHGLNAAYALFRQAFPSESAFRAAGEEPQRQFLLRLNATVERMDPQSGTAWGFRLFWMYAQLMTEDDARLALRYGSELERLGALGRSGAQ